jgi:predicted ATPase/DNA-binding winged helix-turn-helix (wHTH) protein
MKQFDSFRLDTSNECLWNSGVQIALPPKPFAILRYLVENPGRLITHDELLDALWPETYVQPQVLRTYMLELRKVLGDDAGAPRFIQTVPKRGYCFVAAVGEAAESRSPASFRTSIPNPVSAPLSPAIIDREEEISRLRALFELAAGGQRQVVFITGGTGIGKTALLDAFVGDAEGLAPAVVARGQCVEAIGRKEEYYPVMEALSQLCASPDGDRACRILARMAPLWLPAPMREAANGSAPATQAGIERLPGELCAALEELAIEKPLLLVFEDVHWADESTLGLISVLARRRTPSRLMVLATCRPQEGSADQPLKRLKQDLVMRRLGVELELQPLDRQSVGQLLMRELKQVDLPPGLDEFMYKRSEGNPLFVVTMLEHLITQRYLVREGKDQSGAWKQRTPFDTDPDLPDELSQMIELEIERLSPDDQRLLEAASLMNVVFPAWAVAAALEEGTPETEEACDELAHRLHFVRRVGQDELPDGTRSAFYVFAHGLYREVLYQRQSVSRRARRHTRIAERLGELFAGREANVAQEMAMHYEAAGNWSRAASVLRSAAWQALQRRAHGEAEALLEQALRAAENMGEVEAGVAGEIRADLVLARESMQPSGSERRVTEKV